MNRARTKQETYESSKETPYIFSPTNITLKDDGFHGSKSPRFTEWWYFDAIFDNGYSAQMSIRILSVIKNRFVPVFKRLDIYRNGEILYHNKIRYPYKKFQIFKETPKILLDNKQVIIGYKDANNNNLKYDLNFDLNNTAANLKFEGCTDGWKGTTPQGDGWAVILPRAKVNGTIKINGKELKVKGLGYHDHNWDVRGLTALKNHGWFWGKIYFDNFTIVWATIFKNRFLGQPLLVINENNNGYTNVTSKDINFVGTDLKLVNKKLIPQKFILKAKTKDIELDVTMKVEKIHHVKMMMKFHYWRFHLSCKGSITIGSKKEIIDEVQIAEFLKF